ncbi:hypothetical protein GCM10027592_09920 [Spirosoma flavus]
MANVCSYLSKYFLEEYINNRPDSTLINDYRNWLELYCFISKRHYSDLVISGSKELFTKLSQNPLEGIDPLIRILLNQYSEGQSNISFDEWDTNINYANLNTTRNNFDYYFLHSSNQVEETKIRRRGKPTMCNNLQNLEKLMFYESIPVSRDTSVSGLNDWNDLGRRIIPFHSVIIYDNYLFDIDENNGYTDNKQQIQEMINAITVNASTDCKVDITIIFYHCAYKNNRFDRVKISYINNILTQLNSTILQSNFSAVIMDRPSRFHDRMIITNSQLITSGNSFSSYFDNAGALAIKSPTLLHFFSLISSQNNTVWADIAKNFVTSIKSEINDISIKQPRNIFNDPLANRLF